MIENVSQRCPKGARPRLTCRPSITPVFFFLFLFPDLFFDRLSVCLSVCCLFSACLQCRLFLPLFTDDFISSDLFASRSLCLLPPTFGRSLDHPIGVSLTHSKRVLVCQFWSLFRSLRDLTFNREISTRHDITLDLSISTGSSPTRCS